MIGKIYGYCRSTAGSQIRRALQLLHKEMEILSHGKSESFALWFSGFFGQVSLKNGIIQQKNMQFKYKFLNLPLPYYLQCLPGQMR